MKTLFQGVRLEADMTEEEKLAERQRIEKVKEKIAKLLKTSQDRADEEGARQGATAHERELALAKALKIAMQEGLDAWAVAREMERDRRFVVKQVELGGQAKWRMGLMHTLADALVVRDCSHSEQYVASKPNKRTGKIVRSRHLSHMTLVGMVSDVEIVEYLYVYLTRELEKRAEAAYKAERERAGLLHQTINAKGFRDDFYRGATSALYARVREVFGHRDNFESQAHHDEQMALIPLKKAEVDAAFDEALPNTYKVGYGKPMPGTFHYDPRAQAAAANARNLGRAAGAEIDLHRALTERYTGLGIEAPASE